MAKKKTEKIADKQETVKALAQQATELADKVWEEKKWSNEDMRRLLNTHLRVSKDKKNLP